MFSIAFFMLSFDNIFFDILDSVKLGAIQFTLTSGASSAARDKVNPSIAPFEVETIVWFVKPCLTAIVEKNKIDPLFFFKLFCKDCVAKIAPIVFNLKLSI